MAYLSGIPSDSIREALKCRKSWKRKCSRPRALTAHLKRWEICVGVAWMTFPLELTFFNSAIRPSDKESTLFPAYDLGFFTFHSLSSVRTVALLIFTSFRFQSKSLHLRAQISPLRSPRQAANKIAVCNSFPSV